MKVDPATQPISWFRDRNIEGTLILKPPYQRKPVWVESQQAYLIDTILKKYFIPEIYIHRVTDSKGKSIYNVVDGQQRIRAILDFLSGEFALWGEYTPEYQDYDFEALPDSIKTSFFNYTLYVREITEASEDEVRNTFKRMNRNVVALNPQELRHATYSGDFIKLMEEIAEDEFWAENKIVNPREIRRMNDVQFVSELFVSMLNGIQDRAKELDKYYEVYEKDFPERAKKEKDFQKVIEVINEIFPNLKNTRWRNKTDFYTLFCVLSEIMVEKYIPEPSYKAINKQLTQFANEVDEVIERHGRASGFKKEVRDYAKAAVKSTTNKDRRTIRHRIMSKTILRFCKVKAI